MIEQQQRSIEKSARRRLVKGAFAVPAMLTLQSGGAMAASSSSRCLANRNENPITVDFGQPLTTVLGSAMNFMGMSKQAVTTTVIGNVNGGYWIQGSDLS